MNTIDNTVDPEYMKEYLEELEKLLTGYVADCEAAVKSIEEKYGCPFVFTEKDIEDKKTSTKTTIKTWSVSIPSELKYGKLNGHLQNGTVDVKISFTKKTDLATGEFKEAGTDAEIADKFRIRPQFEFIRVLVDDVVAAVDSVLTRPIRKVAIGN